MPFMDGRSFLTGALPVLALLAGIGCSKSGPHPPPGIADPEALSLLGEPLFAIPPGPDRDDLDANLSAAREELASAPDDPERIIWVGRRLGYLWRMREAIQVYTDGIARHPDHAPLYRHRGHRYISVRKFDLAIDDLERAAVLIEGRPDEVEPDGMPNERNIPLTTTGFNVWYHLGLARYLKGDFEGAVRAYNETMKHTRDLDDNVVAVSDWLYMALCRLGRHSEAAAVLDRITPEMDIIENRSYHRRLLLYKGDVGPEDAAVGGEGDLDRATLGYGVGNWHYCRGETARAREIFEQVVEGGYWPAFGTIAAEADLARWR